MEPPAQLIPAARLAAKLAKDDRFFSCDTLRATLSWRTCTGRQKVARGSGPHYPTGFSDCRNCPVGVAVAAVRKVDLPKLAPEQPAALCRNGDGQPVFRPRRKVEMTPEAHAALDGLCVKCRRVASGHMCNRGQRVRQAVAA